MTGEKIGLLLASMANERGYNIADIARKTGLNEKTVKKCFDDVGSTKKSTIDAIAYAIGVKRIRYTVE